MRLIALLLALLAAVPALAQPSAPPVPTATPTIPGKVTSLAYPYLGPCDLVVAAECYSVTRAMTAAYTGPLFQLVRASDSTTMDVQQLLPSHRANLAPIFSFCFLTSCNYNIIYGQINGNHLYPTGNVGNVGISSAPAGCLVTIYACAPPFFIDPKSGLPIVRTLYPTEMYAGPGLANGFAGGANPLTVFFYGRNEGFSNCCGLFGPAHPFGASDIAGKDFLPALGYGNGNTYVNCTAPATVCAHIDIETYATNGADYTPTANQDVMYMADWDGPSSPGTNTISVYVNSSTPIYSGNPASSTTMNVGQVHRLGAGGDGSHVDSIWREGLIANSNLGPAGYTAISSNVQAFYSAQVPNACQSTADYSYNFNTNGGTTIATWALSGTLGAYALRRMSASYYGPIADLTDSEGSPVTTTFGPAATGCGIDPKAIAFCAANAPCRVTKLYNQGTGSTQNVGNVHDTALDLVQATLSAAPTVSFGGLNAQPIMVFTGTQWLCSGALGSRSGSFINYMSFVARRTGNTSVYNAVLGLSSTNYGMGFDDAPNFAFAYFGAVHTGALTENVFHSVTYEVTGPTGSTASNLYVAGTGTQTGTSSYVGFGTQQVCIGSENAGTYPLTGQVAEVSFGANGTPGAVAPNQDAVSFISTITQLEQLVWGGSI